MFYVYYKGVSGMSQGVSRVLKGALRVFPWPFYGCSEGVSRGFKYVLKKFQG